jgi:hypothetical protein
MLARQVTVVCGDVSADWLGFERFFRVLESIMSLEVPEAPLANTVLDSFAGKIVLGKSSFIDYYGSLSHVLETFSSSECQNPKDKVYGLLGLVAPDKRISVNYSVSIEEMFLEVVQRVIADEPHMVPPTHKEFAQILMDRIGVGLDSFDLDRWFKEEEEEVRHCVFQ